MTSTNQATVNPDEYNGWTNRETWAVALHIDNDEGLNARRNEMCEQFTKAADDSNNVRAKYMTEKQAALMWMAQWLETWITELAEDVYFPEPTDFPASQELLGMFHDIGSLWRVDWREIAENFLSEFDAQGGRS